MAKAAAALATAGQAPGRAAAGRPDLDEQLSALGGQIGYGRRFRPRRSQLLLVVLVILGFWLVLVFGRALTEVNETTDRYAAVAAETAALRARLDAGRRELLLVQTDSFQRLQARSFEMGEPGEVVFFLDSGMNGPAPIAPIAGPGATAPTASPLDAWLDLLFGD